MVKEDSRSVPGVHRLGGSTYEVLTRLEVLRRDALGFFLQRGSGGLLEVDAFREGIRFVLNDLRQGIYVLVRAGRPRLVASIANTQYTNTFYRTIKFRIGNEDLDYDTFAARRRNLCRDWLPPHKWWASHGILCTTPADSDFGWGTGMLADIRNMLEATCARRDLDDVEFIVNRRDVPMVRRDGRHAYDFAGASAPTHRPLLPVLSLYQGDAWHDLPMIEPNEPHELRPIPWRCKRPWGLFRGNCTGAGTSCSTNARIAIAAEGQIHEWRLENGRTDVQNLVDAALIGFSKRGKFVDRGVVEFDEPRRLPKFGKRVEMSEWSRWKMLLYVEGFSAALRMTPMLSASSVIIFIEGHSSADRLWFFDRLIPVDWYSTFWQQTLCPPDANVLRIDAPELLRYTLPFLIQHDDVSLCLAQNARRLFEEVQRTRLDFMAEVLATCTTAWRVATVPG